MVFIKCKDHPLKIEVRSPMKKLYIICLLITSSIYPNIFLQSPQKISEAQLEELAQNWETHFCWHYGLGCNFSCCYEQGKASFMLQVLGVPVRSYNYDYVGNLKKFIKQFRQGKKYYYCKPLKFTNPSPKKIRFNELHNLVSTKKFIFYTGAGISASANVPTMHNLEIALKLKQGSRQFLQQLLVNPKEINEAFREFCEQAIHAQPTRAHEALAKIARRKEVCIVTENVDLLQQRTGGAPLQTHSDALNLATPQDYKEIDCIVCIGLSRDDCGFLAHYKKNNPAGILIAIDLGTPDYLSERDFLVQRDLQLILPNLAQTLVIE